MVIHSLPFDSSLFGYPVGKTIVPQSWDERDFLEEAKAFQLVYIFSQSELRVESEFVRLADIKTTFAKELIGPDFGFYGLERHQGDLDGQLVNLALESGAYSRFKLDNRMVKEEFEKLYSLWIRKAWENREILCSPAKEAMVTVSVDGLIGKIGLLAVDPGHRGQGWGKTLVKAAENYALEKGARQLIIPTQLGNSPACKLYQSMGYKLEQKEYIYHYWQE